MEKLQLFASASAALHREMLAFQDLAGRLRSAKAVPRSVALDPAAARPAAPPSDTAPPVPEKEPRKFFSGFDRRGRLVLLAAQVRISGNSAAVVVRKNWRAGGLPQLIAALRPRGVTSAVLLLESGAGLAQLDVTSGKLYGGPRADAGP